MGECYLLDLLLELIDLFGFISERKIFHLERLIDNSSGIEKIFILWKIRYISVSNMDVEKGCKKEFSCLFFENNIVVFEKILNLEHPVGYSLSVYTRWI